MTIAQIIAVLMLLSSFGADHQTVTAVRQDLAPAFDISMLVQMNIARQEAGLAPLAEDSRLERVARDKVEDLANSKFSHTGTDGQMSWHWFTEEGYPYRYAGENLAKAFTDPDTAFAAYMASPTHRANVLDPHYTEVGLYSVDTPIGWTEAVEFGTPAP